MNASTLRNTLILPALISLVSCASADWPAFRHDALRTGAQLQWSPLSEPAKVEKLRVVWRFPSEEDIKKDPNIRLCDGFRASPVVYKGRVFIGNGNGYFYALNAKDGKKIWQYPPATKPPLKSKYVCHPTTVGITASATIAKIGRTDAVIFAAPDTEFKDPYDKLHLGQGHLFALDTVSGKLIWESPVIARLNGCSDFCTDEFHENLSHSSPLVIGDKAYVGVSDHCDNPVQKGRVVAVHLETGKIVDEFKFCSTGKCDDTTRGGGVWSPPAGWQDSLYITTGNTRSGQNFEPDPNYGLSLLRLDAATGKVVWVFQPIPWELDADSDWSAAPTIMSATCGQMILSTQKDGWTHAVNETNGKQLWSFPPHKVPFECGDGTCHGDTRYMRSGAIWGDVYITMNGGLDLTTSGVSGGYHRLHSFNVCGPEPNRLRWLVDVPDTCCPTECEHCSGPSDPCCGRSCNFCLGNPTVTHGVVYIGTNKGYLVAIADPSIEPQSGWRCENPDLPSASCLLMGYRLVPQPRILARVKLKGSMAYTEPVLADGKLYVSTDDGGDGGYVFMLQP